MFRKFIDRTDELRFLEEKYIEDSFNFIVIYGRRRIGKTELIKQFMKGKQAIYFLSDKRGTNNNLGRFKEKISEFLKEPKVELNSFDEVFSYLNDKLKGKKLIIAIDEFSYLVEKDDSIPSVFQLIIDETISNTRFFLILAGSSVSLMENSILSVKSPLYGRRTGQFKLTPLTFKDATMFFPNYSFKEAIEIMAVFGSIPFYLSKVNDEITVLENIKQLILKKGEVLYEEVDFLLKEELRDSSTYKSILEAIASGCAKIVHIANKAKVGTKDLDKYLKVLINLGYVEKLTPITEKLKSKKSIYIISDNFFRFWFSFCLPRLSDLEIEEYEKVIDSIKKQFNAFIGQSFEQICKEYTKRVGVFHFDKLGKWWGAYKKDKRYEIEIDIVALNNQSKEILFGECKWQDNVDAEKILAELKEKAQYVDWNKGKRKESYAIFAKSFKNKIFSKGKNFNVYCFDLNDIEKVLR